MSLRFWSDDDHLQQLTSDLKAPRTLNCTRAKRRSKRASRSVRGTTKRTSSLAIKSTQAFFALRRGANEQLPKNHSVPGQARFAPGCASSVEESRPYKD